MVKDKPSKYRLDTGGWDTVTTPSDTRVARKLAEILLRENMTSLKYKLFPSLSWKASTLSFLKGKANGRLPWWVSKEHRKRKYLGNWVYKASTAMLQVTSSGGQKTWRCALLTAVKSWHIYSQNHICYERLHATSTKADSLAGYQRGFLFYVSPCNCNM